MQHGLSSFTRTFRGCAPYHRDIVTFIWVGYLTVMNTIPTEPVQGRIHPPAKKEITPAMVELLRATKPWVLICSILGFIGTTFAVLFGVVMIGLGIFSAASAEPLEELGTGGLIGAALIYLVLAIPNFLGSLFLWRYSAAIGRVPAEGETHALEDALLHQKSFWKVVGISIIVMFTVYGAIAIGMVALALLAAV